MRLFHGMSDKHSEKRARRASKRAKLHSQRMEYLLDKTTPFAITEAFRNLKAALSVSVPKRDGGVVIMTTSAYPQDGKTTVTANLALMFAISNAKVVIVDADIRKGRVARYFKDKNTPGLSDYLSGQNSLDEVIRETETDKNLSYIPCGTHSPKPYELLESEAMKSLIDELRTRYDYVIIDTPPVLLLSDALALAPAIDGTVLVCRHQVSYISDIARALNTLSFAKANVLGVVVNDFKLPPTKSRGNYDSYYYYSYAYGSTDGSAEDKND